MSSIQETNLKAIADAIRAKDGTTAAIQASKFPERIAAIQTGITPKLVITTKSGAVVTATKGSKTFSGTAGTDGICTLELPEAGEWSVMAAKDGLNETETIIIGTQSMTLTIGYDPVFANSTWEKIIEACQSNAVPDTWAVGDSKTMTIGDNDYQIDIIGKSHDDYADGSGKAPLTFQLHDCIYRRDIANFNMGRISNAQNTSLTYWGETNMRCEALPAILALMPTEVQNGVKEVTKIGYDQSGNMHTTNDKLFILSRSELNGYYTVSEGSAYAYYDTVQKAYNKVEYGGTTKAHWWTRTVAEANRFYLVDGPNGSVTSHVDGTQGWNMSFAFCF